MAKSEVYSWRFSPEMKSALEHEARRERTTMAGLLGRMTQEWLALRQQMHGSDVAEQARLHVATAKVIGSISGRNPRRGEEARRATRGRSVRRDDG